MMPTKTSAGTTGTWYKTEVARVGAMRLPAPAALSLIITALPKKRHRVLRLTEWLLASASGRALRGCLLAGKRSSCTR
jgi:hypothetical protein